MTAPTLSAAMELLQGVDFSPYPGLFDRIPWQEIEDAVMAPPKPFYVVCPKCASPNVSVDATARWEFEAQDWKLSSTFDERTCDDCGCESSKFDEVFEHNLTDRQRAFIYDGADYVDQNHDG